PARAAATATLVVPCQPPGDDCWPAAFTFTPNGRELFYLERFTGEIHRVTLRGGRDRLWGDVGDPAGGSEQGALGIAVDPKWNRKAKGRKAQLRRKRNRWVYVFFTNQDPLENRVVRMRKRIGRAGFITDHLVSIDINTGTNHNGGPLLFGPDRKLYVATGEQAQPDRAQDLADPAGKVLRLVRNGNRPGDNPFPGSLALSFGHRNSFGIGFDPVTGRLWQSENGPNCDDEVNLIVKGGNYGWGGGSSCPGTSTEGPSPIQAETSYTPPIVPTGVTFCVGCGLGPDVEGDLLLAVFGDGTEIRNLSLDGERDDVVDEQVLYDHPSGVVTVQRRPNGQVFFSDRGGIYRLDAA
ncbi:MAG: PQQ-dependent sugar dehydrogenase, partial [Actinomycetota bacterium]